MATALAGTWNVKAHPHGMNAASAGGGGSTAGNSATIAANDFLTLLVTEMKNQDPTATTDPNEYVNQLVQVNSLQQLISINETLKSEAPKVPVKNSDQRAALGSINLSPATGPTSHQSRLAADSPQAGNHGMPRLDGAAMRVATALSR